MCADIWSIQFQDIPDATRRPTTARTVLAAPVLKGNIVSFIDKLNQEFHYEYVLKGHRLIYNNIIITIFQIFKVLPPSLESNAADNTTYNRGRANTH